MPSVKALCLAENETSHDGGVIPMQIVVSVPREIRKRAVELNNPFLAGLMALVLVQQAFILSGCDYIAQTRVLAQVLQTSGESFVANSEQVGAARTPLRLNSTIRPGQVVETTSGATAMVSLLPGMVLLLNPETVIKVDDLRLITDRRAAFYYIQSRQAIVRLIRGSASVTTPPTVESAELRIITPAGALVAPRATCFYIRVGSDAVHVTAAKGQFTFQSKSGGAAQKLDQGYYEHWSSATGATTSAPQAAEGNGDASRQLKQALELEHSVSDLLSQRGNVLPGFASP